MAAQRSLFKRIFKDYALMWAMVVGGVLYPYLYHLQHLIIYTVFIMLVFAYTKVHPRDLKIEPLHYVLFAAQWIMGLLIYFVLEPFNSVLAQGLALITLTPTATSATVIAMMLGGSIAFVTSFLIPCNILVALTAPVLLGALYPDAGGSYWATVFDILAEVSALLILPLVLVWALRFTLPKAHAVLAKRATWTFYVWVATVAIIAAKTVHTIVVTPDLTLQKTAVYFVATMILAMALYFIGQKSGAYFGGQRVSGRQALGQKNTIFAIWIAYTFMDPAVGIIPSFYVICQNILNSLELAIYSREHPNG